MDCVAGITTACPGSLQGTACHLFLALINTLVAKQCSLDPRSSYPTDHGPNLKDGDEFDFIVVGSGSAGSVVANRLAQVSDWKILLLEAGGYPSALTEIPAVFFALQDSEVDWKYLMESSDTFGHDIKHKSCRCPRGKMVGGSSAMNGLLYVRGHKNDYDSWEKAGNPGWSYDSVLKYFQKFENVQVEAEGYGKQGELLISRYKSNEPIRQALEDAYKELGYDIHKDDQSLGYQDCLMTSVKGTRQSAGKAFVAPLKDRQNFRLAINAQVGKLIVDAHDSSSSTSSVKGVEVKLDNRIIKIYAKKEVILSAGAINSPQILMNSGIGPADHLNHMGVDVVKNLHVGRNLQDHVIANIFVDINKESVLTTSNKDEDLDELYKYFMHRGGKYSEVGVANFVAFVNTKNDSSKIGDVQYHHIVLPRNDDVLLSQVQQGYGISERRSAIQQRHNRAFGSLFFVAALLYPKSRGKILLKSSDPYDAPAIIPNFFGDADGADLEALREGVKFVQKLTEDTEALRNHGAEIVDVHLEDCKQFEFKSDDYWRCYIRSVAANIYHPVGTCKMGPSGDPASVVDARLKVHGIEGLRIIDASVMPSIVGGNTNAPSMMIGEKGADMIKEDWLKKRVEL